MYKIDELIPKLRMANLVLEKEEQLLKPYYERMEERERILANYSKLK